MPATTPETCPHGHLVASDDGAFAVVELRDLADGGDRTACCGVVPHTFSIGATQAHCRCCFNGVVPPGDALAGIATHQPPGPTG